LIKVDKVERFLPPLAGRELRVDKGPKILDMIYVFKTSVKSKNQVRKLRPHINSMLPNEKWNFDLGDCDKILRIDSEENIVMKITDLLNVHKFYCEELE